MTDRAARLDSLTSLRFGAALAVFLLHARLPHTGLLADPGRAGVSFFFVLSGFVLGWSHRPGTDAVVFWRRRAARVLPAYLVALLAGVGVTLLVDDPVPGGLWPAVADAALLQSWVPTREVYLSHNSPGWSLSAEAFFYLLFPLLVLPVLHLSRARRRVLQALLLLAVVGVAAVASAALPRTGAQPDSVVAWATQFLPLTRLLEFVVGLTLVGEVRDGTARRVPLRVAVAVAVAAYLLAGLDPVGLGLVAVTLLPFCLLLVVAAHGDLRAGAPVLRARPLVRLGEISFCFYLVHQLVVRVARALGADDTTLALLAVLAVSLLVAAALHHLVERPAELRLRPRALRTSSPTVGAHRLV
jgi:peptidoglycan/LPS O-acetylase OafA/YrhL